MHVLILDDDTQVREDLAASLEACGCSVTSLADGESAIDVVRWNPDIELAIMNWMLPVMDGLVVSRQLKASHAGLSTIIMVGGRFCDEIGAALGTWADEFVSKPQFVKAVKALATVGSRRISVMDQQLVRLCGKRGALALTPAGSGSSVRFEQVVKGFDRWWN